MEWFHFRREKTIPEKVERLLKDLKDESLKALIVFDQRGASIYSYSVGEFFEERDVQLLLNIFLLSDKIVTESVNENSFILLKKILHYEVNSITIKFGSFRLWLIKSQKYYLIAIMDEAIKNLNLQYIESLLMEKLKKLEEVGIIESY